MCTVFVLRRPGHDWPLLLAANRDEMRDRPWRPPARHWPDRPHVVAGLDELAQGSWCGINDDGVLAAVLNREGALGPADGKRSRGELVLDALDHPDAPVDAFAHLDTRAWRPFHLLLADNRDAWLLTHGGDEAGSPRAASPRHRVDVAAIPEGWSMITARGLNNPACPRTRHFLPLFRAAPVPDPADPASWGSWQALLASRDGEAGSGAHGQLNVDTDHGYGTTNASLIALPRPGLAAPGGGAARPVWRFAAGRPDIAPFDDVRLD